MTPRATDSRANKACFPAPDTLARDFLTEVEGHGSRGELRWTLKLHSFFQAFWESVAALQASADRHKWADLCNPDTEEKRLQRALFLIEVVTQARVLYGQRKVDFAPRASTWEKLSDESEERVLIAAREAMASIPDFFVFAIDEARGILPRTPSPNFDLPTPSQNDETVRICLAKVTRLFPTERHERVWALYADTSPAISTLLPAKEKVPSARRGEDTLHRIPPYCPVTLSVTLQTAPELTETICFHRSPQEASCDAILARIGRPLWLSLIKKVPHDYYYARLIGDDFSHLPATQVRCFADPHFVLRKLLAQDATGPWYLSDTHLMALLHQRLDIECPTTSTLASQRPPEDYEAMQAEWVHKGLGVLLDLPDGGARVEMATADEPLVTKVATAFFRTHGCNEEGILYDRAHHDVWLLALRFFRELVRRGFPLDHDELGGISTQALLCICIDRARRRRSFQTPFSSAWCKEAYEPHSAFVHLQDFFAQLMQEVPQELNDSYKGDAWVNFQRFSRAPDNLRLSRRELLMAFLERRAIVAHRGRGNWDLVIPVYCGNLEALFTSTAWIYILVQVKARRSSLFSDFEAVPFVHGGLIWPGEEAKPDGRFVPAAAHPPVVLRLETTDWSQGAVAGPTVEQKQYHADEEGHHHYWDICFGEFDAEQHPGLQGMATTLFPHAARPMPQPSTEMVMPEQTRKQREQLEGAGTWGISSASGGGAGAGQRSRADDANEGRERKERAGDGGAAGPTKVQGGRKKKKRRG